MAVADGTTDSTQAVKSSHLADPLLKPFLQPTFDPAEFFNATLPALSITSTSGKGNRRESSADSAVPLAELVSRTQTTISQLNAQTTRLSNILTQLTDDILRSGGRLAYQVEVLRGETIGLSEVLTEKVQDDIVKFVPNGLSITSVEDRTSSSEPAAESEDKGQADTSEITTSQTAELAQTQDGKSDPPPYISQLRILTLVRARLESVIQVFGEAMKWALPPSEVSFTSSLVSVSAPEPGSDSHSREEKGKAFADALRREISELVIGEETEAAAATARIQALRDLAGVWKGTAEEKARIKFVESLVRLAEEKQKAHEAAKNSAKPIQRDRKSSQGQHTAVPPARASTGKGGGFLENLGRMRGNIYE